MKKLSILIILLIIAEGLWACTLFWSSRHDEILCAKNMDWSDYPTAMLVLPSDDEAYGRIYFGIEASWGFTNTSGMNEKGLWYAGASLPHRDDISNTYDKPEVQGEIVEKIMRECETVDEAIAMYSSYWEPHWDGHSMLADRFGNCVVVEYGEDDVVFIRNTNDHQIATNFYLIDSLNSRWMNCYRYETAETMLGDSTAVSFDLFRKIADATHAEGGNSTLLTTIHDLKKRQTRVFSKYNFEEFIVMDLAGQLAYGYHYVTLENYFNKLHRIGPLDGENSPFDRVELSWTGDGDDYIVKYGNDPELKIYDQIIYHAPVEVQQAEMGWKILLFPVLSIAFALSRKKRAGLIMLFMISFLSTSCYRFEQEQFSSRLHKVILEEQVPGTTLYWKVVSTGHDYNSETIIYQAKVVADEE